MGRDLSQGQHFDQWILRSILRRDQEVRGMIFISAIDSFQVQTNAAIGSSESSESPRIDTRQTAWQRRNQVRTVLI